MSQRALKVRWEPGKKGKKERDRGGEHYVDLVCRRTGGILLCVGTNRTTKK